MALSRTVTSKISIKSHGFKSWNDVGSLRKDDTFYFCEDDYLMGYRTVQPRDIGRRFRGAFIGRFKDKSLLGPMQLTSLSSQINGLLA